MVVGHVALRLDSGRLDVRSLRREALLKLLTAVQGGDQDSPLMRKVAGRWLGLADDWASLDSAARDLAVGAIREGEATWKAGDQALQKRHMEGKLSPAGYQLAWALAARIGGGESPKQWTDRAVSRLSGQEVTSGELLDVTVLMLSRTASKASRSQSLMLAGALSRLPTDANVADETYRSLGRLLQDQPKELESRLAGADGVNLHVAKTLAWVQKNRNSSRYYLALLGKRAAEAKGDRKARWDLAVAYAAGLVHDRKGARAAGWNDARKAFGEAESPETRLLCMREIASMSSQSGRHNHGLSALASVKGQFEGDDRARLAEIQRELERSAEVARKTPSPSADTRGWRQRFDERRRSQRPAAPVPTTRREHRHMPTTTQLTK